MLNIGKRLFQKVQNFSSNQKYYFFLADFFTTFSWKLFFQQSCPMASQEKKGY